MRSPRCFMPSRLLVVTLRRSGASFGAGAGRDFIAATLASPAGAREPVHEQRASGARAVDRGAHDPAGPARSLAHGVEVLDAARAQRLALARDAHRTRAARFEAHEQALIAGETGDRALEARERARERRAQRLLEQQVQAPGHAAEAVARDELAARLAAGEEVARALRRRAVVAAAGLEEAPLERALALDAGQRARSFRARVERHDQRGI